MTEEEQSQLFDGLERMAWMLKVEGYQDFPDVCRSAIKEIKRLQKEVDEASYNPLVPIRKRKDGRLSTLSD